MFVKLYVTVMCQCVYGNLISIMVRIVYLADPPYGTLCLLIQITNRWYIRNHFISNVLKKTKLFSFNTSPVTFFLAVSNLLPRGSPPRVAGTAVTSFLAMRLNCHIYRTRRTRFQLFAPNWDLVSTILCTKNHVISYRGTLRIRPVFVPLWSGRGRAGKKVTAVTFFRCATMTRHGGKYVNAVGAGAHKTWLVGWIDLWSQGWCHGPDRRLHLGHPIYC